MPDDAAFAKDAARGTSLQNDWKAKAEQGHFENRFNLRRTLHGLTVRGLHVLFCISVLLLMVRVWDLIAPKTWIWMSDEQVQSLDNIIFSGLVGAILGKGFNRVVPDKDEDNDP